MAKSSMMKMRDRHKREIFELQEKCKHKEISSWLPYAWVPGHIHSNVKICVRCEKIMEEASLITGASSFNTC